MIIKTNKKTIVGRLVIDAKDSSRYFVTDTGEVYSALKPCVIQGKNKYNFRLNGRQHRMSQESILQQIGEAR
jgi:hypothetical protein